MSNEIKSRLDGTAENRPQGARQAPTLCATAIRQQYRQRRVRTTPIRSRADYRAHAAAVATAPQPSSVDYQSRYYLIGEGHKEFLAEKVADDDFYLLTPAGIACELADAHLTEAGVCLAVGLPLTWTSAQKAEFAAYFSRDEDVYFTYKKVDYHIRITGVRSIRRATPP